MGIKRNIVANYIGQGYTVAVGIAVLPLYLKLLGAEGYGLVGFFMVIQSWLQILDMGISPAFAREVARIRGENRDFGHLKELLHSLELFYLALALAISLSVCGAGPWIARSWLKVEHLPLAEVTYCISLMGVMIGVRCLAAIYSSGIKGMECQVWLNAASVAVATLRFGGGYVLLAFAGGGAARFFEYQLVVAVLELVAMGSRFYAVLPAAGAAFRFSWAAVRAILPFAGGVAYSACIWLLLTQLDKLLLSHLLPLKEYGYFAVVTVVANGIVLVSTPMSQALLPKMTYLLAQGREGEMLALYRKASRFIAVVVFPLAGTVAIYAPELLYAWTGDAAAARWGGAVLSLYALGNGVLAASAFQYYLQYAHGRLRMHVAFNTVFGLVTVPVIVLACYRYSAVGAAMSWFGLNLVSFVVWPPIVHRRFARGIHANWLCADLAPYLATTALLLFVASRVGIPFHHLTRTEAFGALFGLGGLLLLMNGLVLLATRTMCVTDASKSGN